MDTANYEVEDQSAGDAKRRKLSKRPEPRSSIACQTCRDKKVKCSGDHPCRYCDKRNLTCVFSGADKQLYSVSHVQDLESKVAVYEKLNVDKSREPLSTVHLSSVSPLSAGHRLSTSHSSLPEPTLWTVPKSTIINTTTRTNGHAESTARLPVPSSNLSSGDTFGSEVKSLLLAQSTPGSTRSAGLAEISAADIDRQTLFNLADFPSEADAYQILDIVVLNVGISQQLFDSRVFSDHLSLIYDQTNSKTNIPKFWLVEMLIVFAIGRLLQAKNIREGELPGHELFQEAKKLRPSLSEFRRQGRLGIEIMALTALYLQITDRRDDAYIYSNSALRLAILHGMHRSYTSSKLKRSEVVQRNRLWWSVYMQEIRLAAQNGGLPAAIGDIEISLDPPTDAFGFPPGSAIAFNVRCAKITAQITSIIYSRTSHTEASFVSDMHGVLNALSEIENTMPHEYSLELTPQGLLIGGHRFKDCANSIARTSASLHLSIYQDVIRTTRPVLLHVSRSFDRDGGDDALQTLSSTIRRLAESCVESARKSLLILQELRVEEIIAKHAFLDLEAIVSTGFIFILLETILRGQGSTGIRRSCGILLYLVSLGNQAANRRFSEFEQVCGFLSLLFPPSYGSFRDWCADATFDLDSVSPGDTCRWSLNRPFTFANLMSSDVSSQHTTSTSREHTPVYRPDHEVSGLVTIPESGHRGTDDFRFLTQEPVINDADFVNMSLEEEADFYEMYNAASVPLTGLDRTMGNFWSGWT